MIRRALLAAVIAMSARGTAAASDLQIWVDIDGSTYLQNTTAGPLSFDGYQIASESNRLNPAGWKSIADYVAGGEIAEVIAALGPGGLTFGEANPSPANLAELNLGGAGTLQGGAKFYIGKPFVPGSSACYGDFDFFYKLNTSPNSIPGNPAFCIPEPSTFLLAALAGTGLLAFRRRGLRVSPCRPQ